MSALLRLRIKAARAKVRAAISSTDLARCSLTGVAREKLDRALADLRKTESEMTDALNESSREVAS